MNNGYGKLSCHPANSLRLPCSVVAIGTFDGVHRGHQAVIRSAVESAQKYKCPAVVYTFDVPPKTLFTDARILSTPEEKSRLIASLGSDHCVLAKFDRAYASRPADEFLEELAAMNPAEIWVGEDFRFGAGRVGDVEMLRSRFDVKLTDAVRCHEGKVISSTRVRKLLDDRDDFSAEVLLGRFSERWGHSEVFSLA